MIRAVKRNTSTSMLYLLLCIWGFCKHKCLQACLHICLCMHVYTDWWQLQKRNSEFLREVPQSATPLSPLGWLMSLMQVDEVLEHREWVSYLGKQLLIGMVLDPMRPGRNAVSFDSLKQGNSQKVFLDIWWQRSTQEQYSVFWVTSAFTYIR